LRLRQGRCRSLPIGTYLPPPTTGLLWEYLQELFLPAHLAAVAVVPGMALVIRPFGIPEESSQNEGDSGFAAVAGIASLLLYPFVLIVFSFVIQGVLLVRFAVPALAGIAPGIAIATRRLPRVWLMALCLFFLLSSTRTLKHMAGENQTLDRETDALLDVIRRDTGSDPVTFEIHLPYDMVYYAPDLAGRVYVLGSDTPFLEPEEAHTPYFSEGRLPNIWAKRWAERYAALYGTPGVMPWERLKHLPRKFVVVGSDPVSTFRPTLQHYPGFKLRQVERSLYELVADVP
jgi:hypothetical protein